MYPGASPTSQLGQLESEIRQLKSNIRGKADGYKISSLDSRLVAAECELQQIRTEIISISYRLQTLEEN